MNQELVKVPRSQVERLSYIEARLYFLGELQRQDISQRFAVASVQASRDLALYKRLAPENLDYDYKARTYLPSTSFNRIFELSTEGILWWLRSGLGDGVPHRLAAEEVCRAYADYYTANAGDFPPETQESGYLERLKHAYPIHPEVFDRLYEDWSSLDNFQRTRGVLKLMAKVIHRLWTTGNNDLMIQPGSLPLFDSDTRNEAIYYLPQGWDPVLERDIDGERAATTELDNARPLFGSIHACRRIARAVFLGSAPDAGAVGGAKHHRGIELERMLLGCAQPGQVLGHYKDGVRALVDRLQYLNSANNRFWFDTRPNLRREMEDRKRRFDLREDVYPFIKDKLRFANGVFGGTHVFTSSADVPDDWQLRLVVLPPEATFSKGAQSPAIDAATAILKTRGEQPRQKQNRLIFLAPDTDSISRLKDQVTSSLAWKSIVDDVKEGRLNLDGHQTKQASASLDQANEALGRMVRETFVNSNLKRIQILNSQQLKTDTPG